VGRSWLVRATVSTLFSLVQFLCADFSATIRNQLIGEAFARGQMSKHPARSLDCRSTFGDGDGFG